MAEESFYDPENASRSWTELNLGVEPPLLDYLQLLAAVRWLLPRAMAYMSEQYWSAGWLAGLDHWCIEEFPEIRTAASHLGAMCTYWDGNDDNAGEWLEYFGDYDH